MYEELAVFGDAYCGTVQWAAVAEQDDVADSCVTDEVVEKLRPLLRAAAKISRVANPPKRTVPAVEIDPIYSVTPRHEGRTETLEKSRRQTLKKKKAATGRRPLTDKRHPLRTTGHLTIQMASPEADCSIERTTPQWIFSVTLLSVRLARDVHKFLRILRI